MCPGELEMHIHLAYLVQAGSGYVRSIRYQNVRMEDVANPIIIDQFYCDSPKSCDQNQVDLQS